MDTLPDGHIIREVRGLYLITDDSREDWFELDFSRPLKVGSGGQSIPLIEADGENIHTPTDTRTLLYLSHRFDWKISVGMTRYTVEKV